MRTTMMRAIALAAPLALAATELGAQQPTRRPTRRTQPIEIRGQVPTPQVVTVRPREVPAYSRRVLVPNFYDHDFWPTILPGYQLVPQRMVTGNARLDSLSRQMEADSARRAMPMDTTTLRGGLPPAFQAPPRPAMMSPTTPGTPGTTPATTTPPSTTPPTTAPRAPGDTTRSPAGTPPARSTR